MSAPATAYYLNNPHDFDEAASHAAVPSARPGQLDSTRSSTPLSISLVATLQFGYPGLVQTFLPEMRPSRDAQTRKRTRAGDLKTKGATSKARDDPSDQELEESNSRAVRKSPNLEGW